MTITNTTWTPADLLERYSKIKKPKFNRDLVWNIKSIDNTTKRKRANFEEFLQFLFKTRNTVSAISLGSYLHNNEEYHVVIDGNNRINAIVAFFTCPYNVFTVYYKELFEYIYSIPDDKMNINVKEIQPYNRFLIKIQREVFCILLDNQVQVNHFTLKIIL
jgi:hypothetical protein